MSVHLPRCQSGLWRVLWAFHLVGAPVLGAESPAATTVEMTVLRPSPDDPSGKATLAAGTTIEVIERQGDWVRVSVDGWIPATALASSPRVDSRVPAGAFSRDGSRQTKEAVPAVALRGVLRLETHRSTETPPAGVPVWLLPADFDRLDPEEAREDERLAELQRRAERLKRERGGAMRRPNLADAMRQRDLARSGLEQVEIERASLLEARHGRHEARARAAAIASTSTDATGQFRLACPAAGEYLVYARMIGQAVDVEWLESVIAGPDDSWVELTTQGVAPPAE